MSAFFSVTATSTVLSVAFVCLSSIVVLSSLGVGAEAGSLPQPLNSVASATISVETELNDIIFYILVYNIFKGYSSFLLFTCDRRTSRF